MFGMGKYILCLFVMFIRFRKTCCEDDVELVVKGSVRANYIRIRDIKRREHISHTDGAKLHSTSTRLGKEECNVAPSGMGDWKET